LEAAHRVRQAASVLVAVVLEAVVVLVASLVKHQAHRARFRDLVWADLVQRKRISQVDNQPVLVPHRAAPVPVASLAQGALRWLQAERPRFSQETQVHLVRSKLAYSEQRTRRVRSRLGIYSALECHRVGRT